MMWRILCVLLALYGGCVPAEDASGRWQPTSVIGAPSARARHSAVWTGDEMLVWGGFSPTEDGGLDVATGAAYSPALDTWQAIPSANAPAPRERFGSVWTGRELLVWGGILMGDGEGDEGNPPFGDGAAYDPRTRAWRAISNMGAPEGRLHFAIAWTESEMVIWGGTGRTGHLQSGAAYDPEADTWRSISGDGAPDATLSPSAVWTGTVIFVWGSVPGTNPEPGPGSPSGAGARFDPVLDQWMPVSMEGAPEVGAVAMVWNGSEVLVWYRPEVGNEPGWHFRSYDPTLDAWTRREMELNRQVETAVWTGTEAILWDGTAERLEEQGFIPGGRFDTATSTWRELPREGSPPAVIDFSSVWTGSEMIIWGGLGDGGPLASGAIWRP